MKKIKLILAVTTSFILASCSTNVLEQSEVSENSITFSNNIRTIAETNCTLTCHSPSTQLDGNLDLSGDNFRLEAQTNANVVRRIENGSMPPSGPLSQDDIFLVRQWAESGFLE